MTALYVKNIPCKRFDYKFVLLDEHVVEIVYSNRVSGLVRVYRIESLYPINRDLIDEAIVISENLYTIITDKAAKPNIPLYALITVLLRNYRGISYKCKIRKVNCPLKIRKIYDGVEVTVSPASVLEQVYRIMKKYSSL